MDKKKSLRVLILVNLLVMLLLTAAVPMPKSTNFGASSEKSDMIALRVDNYSTSYAYLWWLQEYGNFTNRDEGEEFTTTGLGEKT